MCECKSPSEHAEHLRQEAAFFGRQFQEGLRYYVRQDNGEEVEVTHEEFVAGLMPMSDGGTIWVDGEDGEVAGDCKSLDL